MVDDRPWISLDLTYLARQFYFFENDHCLELIELKHTVTRVNAFSSRSRQWSRYRLNHSPSLIEEHLFHTKKPITANRTTNRTDPMTINAIFHPASVPIDEHQGKPYLEVSVTNELLTWGWCVRSIYSCCKWKWSRSIACSLKEKHPFETCSSPSANTVNETSSYKGWLRGSYLKKKIEYCLLALLS